jgi:hypothetical protein
LIEHLELHITKLFSPNEETAGDAHTPLAELGRPTLNSLMKGNPHCSSCRNVLMDHWAKDSNPTWAGEILAGSADEKRGTKDNNG